MTQETEQQRIDRLDREAIRGTVARGDRSRSQNLRAMDQEHKQIQRDDLSMTTDTTSILRKIREALQLADDDANGPITDTIWMPGVGCQTLFDFIDEAIEAAPVAAIQPPIDLRNVTVIDRSSDMSVTITFASCRAASQFGHEIEALAGRVPAVAAIQPAGVLVGYAEAVDVPHLIQCRADGTKTAIRLHSFANEENGGTVPLYLAASAPAQPAWNGESHIQLTDGEAELMDVVRKLTEKMYAEPAQPEAKGEAHAGIIEMALDVVRLAHDAMDDTEEDDNGKHWDVASFDALSAAMDRLEALPDDRPGYVMGPAAKVAWALRAAPVPAAPANKGEIGQKITRLIGEIRAAKSLAWRDGLIENLIDLIEPSPLKHVLTDRAVMSACILADRARQAADMGRMRSAFHVNMLRAYPGKSHEEIASEIDKACGQAAIAQPSVTVPEGWKLPFRVETDEHEVVSIQDADNWGMPFELNTHTQRALDDAEGLAEELRAAQALANFMVSSMNAAAPPPPASTVPDDLAPLLKFYAVDSLEALARIQNQHIAKLQTKLPKLADESTRPSREG